MRLIVEGAGNQHIESSIASFAGGGYKVGALDCAKLRTDKYGRAFLGVTFHVAAFGADEIAGPGDQRSERDPVLLVGLLHSGDLEVLQDHLGEGLFRTMFSAIFLHRVDQLVILIHAQHAMGAEALHGEWTGHADLLLVVVRLVIQVFGLRLGSDGRVDLLLAADTQLPTIRRAALGASRDHFGPASRGISHSCQDCFRAALSWARRASNIGWCFSQITSISALLAMDFSVMCGTRS